MWNKVNPTTELIKWLLESTGKVISKEINQLLLICQADAQGKGKKVDYSQANHWRYLREECEKITAQPLIAEGIRGEAIKIGLHQSRVKRVKNWKKNEK